jgi:hypothetical protein
MEPVLFRYRSRTLGPQEIGFIQRTITQFYAKGRSHIARALCEAWGWIQPNGQFKQCAARDLLLRLEEKGFIDLPPRLRPKNNLKRNTFAQVPLFRNTPLEDTLGQYGELSLHVVTPSESYLWNYLVHQYHYLGQPKLVGEHLRYLAFLNGQVVACLGWASAAFKVEDRDQFIGWDIPTRHQRLCFIANNVRFLILPWIHIKHLASKVLAFNLRRLSNDWQRTYAHPLYLAETFVDVSRFQGTCYRASNWIDVGLTKGSAKRGNHYHYHGQSKAIYLYPLHRDFRRKLTDDPG